ncbi:hypothetical protein DI43_18260 [Geobacillus sp. CAMR12739]|nr:hypothetical protein DI43_18260 [Geobacillus sp. CAMR12739]
MFRLFFLVFAGKARHHEDAHEAPASMVAPMLVLGVLSIASGYMQTPWFGSFLGEWLTDGAYRHEAAPGWIAVLATIVSFAGSFSRLADVRGAENAARLAVRACSVC